MKVAFLSQHRFPRLWSLFQYVIGGTVDKRHLCLKHYNEEESILEVGCSLGNISKVFVGLPEIAFTGLDIDPVVIDYAQKHFPNTDNYTFVCQDLRIFAEETDNTYDYILFAGMCHHVGDQECLELLNVAANTLLNENGKLIVVDPLIPRDLDSKFVHSFFKLEQGSFVRTGPQLEGLLDKVNSVQIKEKNEYMIGASPVHWPVCARFGVYRLGL
jgi:SAM-dependent methyltransferase